MVKEDQEKPKKKTTSTNAYLHKKDQMACFKVEYNTLEKIERLHIGQMCKLLWAPPGARFPVH